MTKDTDLIQQKLIRETPVDDADRRLLGVLVEDAGVSYAELGARAGLSAPAAHERVKRMRRSGAIRRTAALLDADRVGKPLLAFVLVDTRGWGKTPELLAIASYPEVEEIHSVAGDACMLLKVRTADTRALEGLLARLYDTPGVRLDQQLCRAVHLSGTAGAAGHHRCVAGAEAEACRDAARPCAMTRGNRRRPDRARRAARPGRQAARSAAASAAVTSSAVQLPSPTRFSEPTIERTWLCRNERAEARDGDRLAAARDIEPVERLTGDLRLAPARAEGGEVVPAEQPLRRLVHRLGVERLAAPTRPGRVRAPAARGGR